MDGLYVTNYFALVATPGGKGESHISNTTRHRMNVALSQFQNTIVQQLKFSNKRERYEKRVQFATLFHILSEGRLAHG